MLSLPKYAFTAVQKLNSGGFAAYPVGGCVRDALLHVAPHDCDITTSALPEDILNVFSEYTCAKTGIAHGTVTVIIDGIPLEITTFRTDGVYTDCRHPDSVAFTDSLSDDLSRRDFTVNAMAYDFADNKVIDCFGGCHDLRNGIIRCVGNPDTRFREDALRIIRALRFASTLGFSIEENTKQSLIRNAPLLQKESAERLRDELIKLLCGRGAGDIVCEFSDVIMNVIPELEKYSPNTFNNFRQAIKLLSNDNCTQNSLYNNSSIYKQVISLAILLGDMQGNEVRGVMRRLRFDNKTSDTVITLLNETRNATEPNEISVKWCLNRLNCSRFLPEQELFLMITELYRAYGNGMLADELLKAYEGVQAKRQCYSLKQMEISGNDLSEIGYTGVKIGKELNDLLGKVINGDIKNNRADLLDTARDDMLTM